MASSTFDISLHEICYHLPDREFEPFLKPLMLPKLVELTTRYCTCTCTTCTYGYINSLSEKELTYLICKTCDVASSLLPLPRYFHLPSIHMKNWSNFGTLHIYKRPDKFPVTACSRNSGQMERIVSPSVAHTRRSAPSSRIDQPELLLESPDPPM